MRFLRRFLAPILLASWLFPLVLVFFITGRITLAFDLGDVAFTIMFITAGMLGVGYPTGYFLAQRGTTFRIAVPLLMIAGAMGGAAIGFLISLPGQELRTETHSFFSAIGALAGVITASIWAVFNADLYRRAPETPDK